MTRFRTLATAVSAAMLFLWLACGDDAAPPTDPDPTPGHLAVSLSSPNADDGAVLFTVSGGPIAAPAPAVSEHAFFHRATDATSLTVLLAGDIESGALLEFDVEDVADASAYSATLVEVADRENALREDLADYTLDIQER